MNVLFYSKPYFMDCDLPFVAQLRAKGINVKYLLEIAPHSKQSTFLNIETLYPKAGVFKADIYKKEMLTIQEILDWENTFVINRVSSKVFALSNIIVSIKLFHFLLKQKFEILHSTVFFDFSEWIMYLFRKKILLTVHDPFPHTGELTKRKSLNRWIGMKLIKFFLILNEAQKQQFIAAYKLQSTQVYSSKLGVYTSLRLFLKKTNEHPFKEYILFFGRISPYKGVEFLLKAMLKVHELYPRINLIVAGSGKFDFDIGKYATLNYVEIRNRFIPTEELVELIDASKFVVCPYTDATQSGVIMSCYAFNKPVIASDVGGLSEMVKHQKNGLLVTPSNADKLSQAIIELLGNDNLLKEFSRNIRSQYENGSDSWSVITSEIVSAYIKMINKYLNTNSK